MPETSTACRGVRGATTVEDNTPELILAATRELLGEMVSTNAIASEDIASVLFTLTPDLNAEYPAAAAREVGWTDVPLMCAQEIDKPDALPRTIRVLILWNTGTPQHAIRHCYLRGAAVLRPDLLGQSKGEGV